MSEKGREAVPPMAMDPLHIVETLAALENRFRGVFKCLVTVDEEFLKKYDLDYKDAFDGALFYLWTTQPIPLTYSIEAFPMISEQSATALKRTEELTYHPLFEEVIERYTKTHKKPNPVLLETRASDFCYLLTIKIEAIPQGMTRPKTFLLLREYQVLLHVWESYRTELTENKCATDQLVGFPMPFEFRNVVGTSYDLPQLSSANFEYYGTSGKLESLTQVLLPPSGTATQTRPIKSSLSYLSMEKVGPSLAYLMDLMGSQGKCFSVSSALKVYDQIICRLLVMHKYSVIHCDINPASLCFGTGEAANVLYVNSFDSALVSLANCAPLPFFRDRFVAQGRVKDKAAHFVHDLEAAFYVFIYLLLGRLPWDSRLTSNEGKDIMMDDALVLDARSEKSRTVEDKEKFWQSSSQFVWLVKSVEMESNNIVYKNFTSDIVESIYSKVKESIAACQVISRSVYCREVFIQGSAPYNAYFGIRKIITSYFRFEMRSTALKDPVWSSKTEILFKDSDVDKRLAWDLSYWCWNYLDTSISSAR